MGPPKFAAPGNYPICPPLKPALTILYYTILYFTILYYTIIYYTLFVHIILYYTIKYSLL